MDKRVALVKADSYEQEVVDRALREALDLVGGLGAYVKPGMKVLLKVNLLMKKRPEEATTTHPNVVAAVARMVKELGATAIIGDSPGGPYNEGWLRGIYAHCGMEEAAQLSGAELNHDFGVAELPAPNGKLVRKLEVIRPVVDADLVISLCKFKTHGMTTFTGAVKNLFGVIPGMAKVEYHLKMPEVRLFTDLLVDICEAVHPGLSIMDAIVGMEGMGPSAGDPRHVGALLVSPDPHALDLAACALIGLGPQRVSTLARALERGLIPSSADELETSGATISELYQAGFKVPKARDIAILRHRLPKGVADFLSFYLRPRPVFDHSVCIGCSDCARHCPPQCITMVDRRPQVDLNQCIRCFCCQELCPHKAVSIKRPFVSERLLRW